MVVGPDNLLLKHILRNMFLKDVPANTFAVTKMSDVLQEGFLAKVVPPYHTDHVIYFLPACFSSRQSSTAKSSIVSSIAHRLLSLSRHSSDHFECDETSEVSFPFFGL